MDLEIFAICDAATASGNEKLNVLGVFDLIQSPTEPIVYPSCNLAIRIRFNKSEAGKAKAVRISVVDTDKNEVFPALAANVEVPVPRHSSSSIVQIVAGIIPLKLPRFGEYQIDLAIDGQVVKSLPLIAMQQKPAAP